MVEKEAAVTLYYLVDEGRMGKEANAFGFGKSTVLHRCTYYAEIFFMWKRKAVRYSAALISADL